MSPSEQSTSSDVSLRMASTARSTWFMRRVSGPRTATTMQKWLAPDASVARAAASTSSSGRNGWRWAGESKWIDCEQKPQSSEHPPVFALISDSSSTPSPHHLRRTSWARLSRAGSSDAGRSTRARASSTSIGRLSARTRSASDGITAVSFVTARPYQP